jgi:hypothetical protein
VITDVGVTILADTSYTISPTQYMLWAASSDVIVAIANGSLIVNDGSSDWNVSDGVDIIKGFRCCNNTGGGGGTFTIKTGTLTNTSFAGNPKVATVIFTSPFPSSIYSITIDGIDKRFWSFESKTANGFVINSNANQSLTDIVTWIAAL